MHTYTVQFQEWTCIAEFRRYRHGGGVAIYLVDATDGQPVATATINPETPVPEGCVAIKDWSENTGTLAALIAAGLVEDTGRRIPCAYTEAALCRLRVTPGLP